MNTIATTAAVNPSTPNPQKPQQRQTAKEIIAANVKELIAQLEAGRSDALTAYLDAMSRFHNYSFGNVLEIARQRLVTYCYTSLDSINIRVRASLSSVNGNHNCCARLWYPSICSENSFYGLFGYGKLRKHFTHLDNGSDIFPRKTRCTGIQFVTSNHRHRSVHLEKCRELQLFSGPRLPLACGGPFLVAMSSWNSIPRVLGA